MSKFILDESECVDVAKLCGWEVVHGHYVRWKYGKGPATEELLQKFIHNPLNIGYLLAGLDRFVGTDHLANRIVCNFGDSLQFGEFKKVHTGFLADLKKLVKEGGE